MSAPPVSVAVFAVTLLIAPVGVAVPVGGLPALEASSGPPRLPTPSRAVTPPTPVDPEPHAPRAAWSWPLDPRPEVLTGFAPPAQRWLAGHRGVDLAAAVGQEIRAPADGRVTHAGPVAGRGVVSIDHRVGARTVRSTYEPVLPRVRRGDVVRKGDVLATLAPSGPAPHCGPRPCLHWGARLGPRYVDPRSFLASQAPVRLLPLR